MNKCKQAELLEQGGSPVVEGTIQHMAMEIAALKKERDDFERKWLESLKVQEVVRLEELLRQIRADLDAHDVLPEWLPIIDNALAKLGADKGENK